ncbi:MAG: conjugal transfer protein TraX [Oscillibacter sp.]|nr:conjugal transfer protein TraX [Oscillibacter sp.]MCI8689675.1 conjugal transfer protein TraX [Oscillibacter sp.]
MTIFTLKMTAAGLMFLDHIGLYFPGAPVWLRWLGRGAYPLFLFCMAQGYRHTRNRKRYLLRLYVMSLFMTALGYGLDTCFPTENGYGNHNIFVPLFLTGLLISAIELYQRDRRRGTLLLGGIAASQIFYLFLPVLVPAFRDLSGDVLTGIVPNLAVNEFGFSFVALGLAFYFLRDRREALCAVYLIFCIYQFSEEMAQYGGAVQWMMVMAMPLIFRYNGEKGPGWKWFFYIFYPAHTCALFFLSNFS